MRKEYLINDLAQILGCSRTAIVKKIKEDDKTGIRRYKNCYDVVMYNGQMAILLDDEDLEKEKSMSRGFNNVSRNGYNIPKDSDIIDVEAEKEEVSKNELLNFTERYINEFKTFQETTYNELRNVTQERNNFEKQIFLLEDSQRRNNEEYNKTRAENVTLKRRNTLLTVVLCFITLVLVCFITFFITYKTVYDTANNVSETFTKKSHAEIQKNIELQHGK